MQFGILLVDDEELILRLLRRMLRSEGFSHIVTALSAKQGIKLIEEAEKPFFLIISDLYMPGMNGSAFLAKCVEISPDSRRILLTGFMDHDASREAVNRGAIHKYLIKPVKKDDLSTAVRGELDVYKKLMESRRLLAITKGHNIRLFKFANELKRSSDLFRKKIDNKKTELAALKEKLKTVRAKAERDTEFVGLDAFFSRTLLINPENMKRAFVMIKNELAYLLGRAESDVNPFIFPDKIDLNHSEKPVDQRLYPLMDALICLGARRVEKELHKLGEDVIKRYEVKVDDQMPDMGDLALEKGLISPAELERLRAEIRESDGAADSLDALLVKKGLLRRRDLSRLHVQRRLIDIRFRDKIFAGTLLDQEIVSKKEIDQAFMVQTNRFEGVGECASILDVLEEQGILSRELIQKLFQVRDQPESSGPSALTGGQQGLRPDSHVLDGIVDLMISQDHTKASIKLRVGIDPDDGVDQIKDLIRQKGITFGLVEDHLLQAFLKYGGTKGKEFVVAMGRKPVPGQNARIKYFFDTEYRQPGILAEDGSIDFRDRGDVPHVLKGGLLAEKKPVVQGQPGYNIFGEFIPVDPVKDVSLRMGEGVRLSEDGLKLHASIEGQPCLDPLKGVSVFREFMVKGDVDYETGHIRYDGNVTVTGVVKPGFEVHCVGLTVEEINGGIIDISGDLNVSRGIINADVKSLGNIRAKFVNNARIEALGDLMVSREIMGSDIAVSGEIENKNGRITSSTVASGKGMILGRVGTAKSERSTIKIGVDDHREKMLFDFAARQEEVQKKINRARESKRVLEERNFALHREVADLSLVQENLRTKVHELRQDFARMKDKNEDPRKITRAIKELEDKISRRDDRIKEIFNIQDRVLKEIEVLDQTIRESGQKMDETELEKDAAREILACDDGGGAFVKVHGGVQAGTRIVGREASMVARDNLGSCKIMEIESHDPDNPRVTRQIAISNL